MDWCLIGAEEFSWASLQTWWAILKVVAGLGAVIFVHELGHFLVAKACGVKCEKFYLGFDAFDIKIGQFVLIPRKLFKFQWGETEYGIGIIPLGGYVKMLGQDDNPANAERECARSMVKQDDADSASDDEIVDDVAEAELDDNFQLDPRSYQAKSVPQRMAIISAGVIMNLIFAVIFASIAYQIGVPYQPAIVGSVSPGGPAWEADMRPGSRVVAIGEEDQRREHMRFYGDFTKAIVYNGAKSDIQLFMMEPGSEDVRQFSLRPVENLVKMKGARLGQIGVNPTNSMVLNADTPTFPDQSAEKAGLQGGDHILSARIGDQTFDEIDYPTLTTQLAQNPDAEVVLVVERATSDEDKTTVELKLPPNPMRFVGLEMEMEPIAAVQAGSPAATAGFLPGDELLAIDGGPIGHAFTIANRMRIAASEEREVVVTVRRDDGNGATAELDLEVTPRQPRTRYPFTYDLPIAIDELGICFRVSNVVANVQPGSSAAVQGILPGDVITAFEFIPANDEQRERETTMGFAHDEVDLTDLPSMWPSVFVQIQQRLSDTKFHITVNRDGTSKSFDLVTAASTDIHQSTRGFLLTPLEKVHRAESIGDAVSLGFRETKESAMLVFGFLRKLFTREISPVNLGGPGTIAVAATHESLGGTARLLLFLTLLSANLAVVNFLPIPVLDGGHMVFLMWEAVFRKPLSERVMVALSMAGLVFIVGLMLFVISLDIWRFIPG